MFGVYVRCMGGIYFFHLFDVRWFPEQVIDDEEDLRNLLEDENRWTEQTRSWEEMREMLEKNVDVCFQFDSTCQLCLNFKIEIQD